MRPGPAGEAQLRRRLKKRKARAHARQQNEQAWEKQLIGKAKKEQVTRRLAIPSNTIEEKPEDFWPGKNNPVPNPPPPVQGKKEAEASERKLWTGGGMGWVHRDMPDITRKFGPEDRRRFPDVKHQEEKKTWSGTTSCSKERSSLETQGSLFSKRSATKKSGIA